jgi:hypothetical protein
MLVAVRATAGIYRFSALIERRERYHRPNTSYSAFECFRRGFRALRKQTAARFRVPIEKGRSSHVDEYAVLTLALIRLMAAPVIGNAAQYSEPPKFPAR